MSWRFNIASGLYGSLPSNGLNSSPPQVCLIKPNTAIATLISEEPLDFWAEGP